MSLFAQDLILRAGSEVYRYDEGARKWSDNPLPINSVLSIGDSIKSYTTFTVEIPRTWKNIFTKRIYTYIKYEKGVRLNGQLIEKTDCYSAVPTNVIPLGESPICIEHISWLLNNKAPLSPFGVVMEIYNSNLWIPIECDSTISLSTPVTLTIINEEPFDVFAYILWKDNKWSVIGGTSSCLRISPFSSGEFVTKLDKPLGNQSAFLLCSKKPIPEDVIKSVINGERNAFYNATTYGDSIVYDIKTFNIVE